MRQFEIREHMEVIASDGKNVGTVDRLEGSGIKLTRDPSDARGKHHFIGMNWVDHVDTHVHLNKNSQEVMLAWKSAA
jgi:hypothetical protein